MEARELRDLEPGESGWGQFSHIVIDPQRRCYINPTARLGECNILRLHVTRTHTGIEIWIPAREGANFRWEPGVYDPENSAYKKYLPVTKIEYESQEGNE